MKFKFLYRNGLTLWIRWLILKFKLEKKYHGLSFGYMSEANNCSFANNNVIGEKTILANVEIGDYSYVSGGCHLQNVVVGKFCSIAPDCKIGLGIHPTSMVSTHPAFYTIAKDWGINRLKKTFFIEFKQVVIENDVWLGYGAIIKDGIRIGDGAIVAAGSVVTKDVPPYAIVGGCPAKIIRYRFNQEIIEKLERIKWWNWNIESIRKFSFDFTNVEEFILKHDVTS